MTKVTLAGNVCLLVLFVIHNNIFSEIIKRGFRNSEITDLENLDSSSVFMNDFLKKYLRLSTNQNR